MGLINYLKNYFQKKPEKDSTVPEKGSSGRESFIANIKPHTGNLYPPGHASDIYLTNGGVVTVINREYSLTEMLRKEGLL